MISTVNARVLQHLFDVRTCCRLYFTYWTSKLCSLSQTLFGQGQSLPKTATSALMICSEGCFRHVGSEHLQLGLAVFPLICFVSLFLIAASTSTHWAAEQVCRCGLLAPCSEGLAVVLYSTHYCRGLRPKRIGEELVLGQEISVVIIICLLPCTSLYLWSLTACLLKVEGT